MELINAISGSVVSLNSNYARIFIGATGNMAVVSTQDLAGRTGYANIYFFYN